MKVLVTGAAGQVGCRVVRQLMGNGHEVRGAVLPEDPCMERLTGLDLEQVAGDLNDYAFVQKALDGVDAVLHTANLTRDGEFQNNVMTTFNVAKACSEHADQLERLVSISSSAVYPNDSQDACCDYHPVDENHPRRPIAPYGLAKLIGEEAIGSFARATGLRATIIRPSGIVSGDAVLDRWTVGFVAGMLRTGKQNPKGELYLPGCEEPWLDLEARAESAEQPCAVTGPDGKPWIYQLVDARDVAHGLICGMGDEAGVGEAFNISAPKPIEYPEAAGVLAEEVPGGPVLCYQAPVRWIYDNDNSKARHWIGYSPRWGIREMIRDAVSFREGQSDGMT